MICGSGGSKCRLAKAAGAEPFGEIRDEKLHGIVARRCTKHISKSKCTKHTNAGALLEVEMLKRRTPLWREAHVEVKMPKPCQLRSTFRNCDVQKVHGVVARSAFGSEHAKNTTCSRHFWALKRRFVAGTGFCTLTDGLIEGKPTENFHDFTGQSLGVPKHNLV